MIRAANLNPPKMEVSAQLVACAHFLSSCCRWTIVIWLLVGYYSPGYAAFYGIATMVVVALLQKEDAAVVAAMDRGVQGGGGRSVRSSPSSWPWWASWRRLR